MSTKSNPLSRIRVISLGVFVFALFIIVRLYILQIADHSFYTDKANKQYSSTVGDLFNRGNIFFSNKDGSLVSAATLESGFAVAINPKVLKNPEEVYTQLNAILPTDHDSFITKASKLNDPYEELATKINTEIGNKINALKIPGLTAYEDRWRFYPGASIAAHTIGMLGFKGNEYAGRYGLEREYEKELERKDTGYVNFFAQIFSNIKKVASSESAGEADVVTTIEPTAESYLEGLLSATARKWSADSIGGIVMNPATGEIYAMEKYPTFDPNHPEEQKDVNVFSNPLIENVYEMGSIIKPLTVSAGIDAGVITATSTYYDAGFVMVNGEKLKNFDSKVRGVVSIQDLLSQSLNVGAVHVEQLLGNKLFTKYMYGYGVNQKTGIDLPNEGRNLTLGLESSRDIEHATASFGQGIALTPIATIRALAVVANGGFLVSPHVTKGLNYTVGISTQTAITTYQRVLKPGTTDAVTKLLVHSVDFVLLNGSLHLPHYSVAAKTGTAQIPNPGGLGYSDKVLHSFIGYFPAYNPKFIILLYMVNPTGAQFGSETLTTPFMDMVNFLVNYYEVPPDR